ncbi:MAG: glycosyl hydrolase [Candidatus Promineifilaceae bacterium]
MKNTKQYPRLFLLLFIILLIACGTVIQPNVPTLIPTAASPNEELAANEALLLLPTFTPLPDIQPEVAGLTPADPYTVATPTDMPPLPTRTPTRTLTPTVTPTSPPTATSTPSRTASPTSALDGTITPVSDATATTQPLGPAWTRPTPHAHPVTTIPRQGFAASLYLQDSLTFGQWSYSWSPYVTPNLQNLQHVPMLTGGPRDAVPTVATLQMSDNSTNHNYWLVFNECEHQFQCNSSPQNAADFLHNQILPVVYDQGGDPDAKLIIGGVNTHPCGIKWLTDFVVYYEATYGPLPHAGWHFHMYPEIRQANPTACTGDWVFDDNLFPNPNAAFELWRQYAYNALTFVQTYGEQTDEIWFTEMGCLNYGFHQIQEEVCQGEGFLSTYAPLILGWLNGEGRWVTRYAWYTDWTTAYYKITALLANTFPPGHTGPMDLTDLGQFYANVDAAAAVPLPWP